MNTALAPQKIWLNLPTLTFFLTNALMISSGNFCFAAPKKAPFKTNAPTLGTLRINSFGTKWGHFPKCIGAPVDKDQDFFYDVKPDNATIVFDSESTCTAGTKVAELKATLGTVTITRRINFTVATGTKEFRPKVESGTKFQKDRTVLSKFINSVLPRKTYKVDANVTTTGVLANKTVGGWATPTNPSQVEAYGGAGWSAGGSGEWIGLGVNFQISGDSGTTIVFTEAAQDACTSIRVSAWEQTVALELFAQIKSRLVGSTWVADSGTIEKTGSVHYMCQGLDKACAACNGCN